MAIFNVEKHKKVKEYLVERGFTDTKDQGKIVVQYGRYFRVERSVRHICENWDTFRRFVTYKVKQYKEVKRV